MVLTNDTNHIHSHTVIPTINSISDHFITFIATRFIIESKSHDKIIEKDWKSFAKHNFSDKDVDWFNLKLDLSIVDWNHEFSGKSVDKMLELFYKLCYEVVYKYVPLKINTAKAKKGRTEKEIRKITRGRRRINKSLLITASPLYD